MIREKAGSDTQARLIRRARAESMEALDALLAPFRDIVRRLAYRIMGDEDDAEDLAQEAFVRIVQRLPAYRGECAFGTWVYRVALNVCLTAKDRRREPADDVESLDATDPSPGPEARAIQGEMQARVREEIARLRPAYREAVLLRLIAELPYDEIAKILQVNENVARLRVHRGMKQLRKRLDLYLP